MISTPPDGFPNAMYIILTTRPGQYRSEGTEGIRPLESYVYHYDGHHVATFTIAEADRHARVRIVEADGTHTVNSVPSRFFEHFDTREAAWRSLNELIRSAHGVATLSPIATS
jgi:hypothetical protein